MELKERIAIVTGAGSGIGRAIALKLAEHGADIAIVYGHNDANAQKSAEMIRDLGQRALVIKADVVDPKAVAAMADKVIEKWGRIDILVNNAGIFKQAPLLEMSEEQWDDVLDVNLKGPFLCTQSVGRHMAEAGTGGKVINIGSIDGTGIAEGIANYAVSKMGLIQLTRCAALELAPYGINVNIVSPGSIATGMALADEGTTEYEQYVERIRQEVPLKRMGEGEEIADMVLFLASDKSDYVTGSEFVVDGGVLLRPYSI
jgi:NAD(P)-dependent dehydrogenase (short-subunit alcohol dehydrogenase family)